MRLRFAVILLSALVFGLSGCKSAEPARQTSGMAQSGFTYRHYFSDSPQRLLFKTHLTLAKQEFSGVLVVKRLPSAEYRIVFTTETGFKVFDFTLTDSGYVANYGVGPIAKKFIAVRLAFTVQAFLLRNLDGATFKPSDTPGSGSFTRGRYRYEIRKTGERVLSQTLYYKGKRKATAQFSGYSIDVPDSASVIHVGFPLSASFRFLKQ